MGEIFLNIPARQPAILTPTTYFCLSRLLFHKKPQLLLSNSVSLCYTRLKANGSIQRRAQLLQSWLRNGAASSSDGLQVGNCLEMVLGTRLAVVSEQAPRALQAASPSALQPEVDPTPRQQCPLPVPPNIPCVASANPNYQLTSIKSEKR